MEEYRQLKERSNNMRKLLGECEIEDKEKYQKILEEIYNTLKIMHEGILAEDKTKSQYAAIKAKILLDGINLFIEEKQKVI